MSLEWQDIARVLVTVTPALVALVGFGRGPGGLRSRLAHDVELVDKLPPDSGAAKSLLAHIEAQIGRIAKLETEASRDWPMLVFAGIAAPISGLITIYLAQGEWWQVALSVLSGFLALVFLYGIFDSAQKVPRDEKRNRI